MLGPSQGEPIIVHDNPERLDFFISEGIEDAASIAVATGSRRISGFDNLFITADDDFAGRRALQRAREMCPDVVHLKSANGADANETIRQSGADTITASKLQTLSSNFLPFGLVPNIGKGCSVVDIPSQPPEAIFSPRLFPSTTRSLVVNYAGGPHAAAGAHRQARVMIASQVHVLSELHR
jgi:hypothetical protein